MDRPDARSPEARPSRSQQPPSRIAETLARHAIVTERAVLVGNRAGIVEWANEAWMRMTGFPLDATLAKPIAHFLGEADIELELIDFVGQRFLEGRPCTLEFPFETFDERSIWVHLEVQPIRNAAGEIAEFVAIATDETERRARELAAATPDLEPGSRSRDPDRGSSPSPALEPSLAARAADRVSLSQEAARACHALRLRAGPRLQLDVSLDPALPPIRSNRLLLGELIRRVLDAAAWEELEESWGCLTVMTGLTRAGRSHVSQAHPVPARPAWLARRSWLFLEVHDTGPTLGPRELEDLVRACSDTRAPSSLRGRAHALAVAHELAATLGGALHVDSTPGCGTQALLLLPLDEGADDEDAPTVADDGAPTIEARRAVR